MSSFLQIDSPMAAPLLPGNYLPMALEALRNEGQGPNRILLLLPGAQVAAATETSLAGPSFFVLSAERLARPELTAEAMRRILERQGGPATHAVLGPPTGRREDLTGTRMELPLAEEVPDGGIRRVLLVVDAGIAFWNRRFCAGPGGGGGFRGVAFLDVVDVVPMLGPAEIASLCQRARLPDGDRKVMDELRTMFPYSHFGRWRDPLEFWHGTAVADLALDPAKAAEVALFGLELPRAAVEDRSGRSLTTIIPLVIQTALAMTGGNGLDRLPLDVVLPYAFTGGPHDGGHPVTESLRDLLAWARVQRREVRLHLPAGNHRQDACHAVLPAGRTESVGWDLPPDDHSSNTIEINIPAATEGAISIALTDPRGQSAEVPLRPDQFCWVLSQDGIVGALVRLADHAGAARLKLTLAPTAAANPGPGLAQAGRWKVAIDAPHPAHLWILRDDRDLMADGALPRRASRFAHPTYTERGAQGDWPLTDPPDAVVRRAGTISVMATVNGIEAVAAGEALPKPELRAAPYSGLGLDGQPSGRMITVDEAAQPPGRRCLGNGTGRHFRMSGTSAAAALSARDP